MPFVFEFHWRPAVIQGTKICFQQTTCNLHRCVAMGLLSLFQLPVSLLLMELEPGAIVLGYPNTSAHTLTQPTPTHTLRLCHTTTLQQTLYHVALPSVPLITPARHIQINLQSQSVTLPVLCLLETDILSLQSFSLASTYVQAA